MGKSDSLENIVLLRHIGGRKGRDAGRDAGWDAGKREKGTTEDGMAGWHHRRDGRGFQ